MVKVDDVLRGVVRAWLSSDGLSAEETLEARRRSLQPDPQQHEATKEQLVSIINGRLAVHNRKREAIPTDPG